MSKSFLAAFVTLMLALGGVTATTMKPALETAGGTYIGPGVTCPQFRLASGEMLKHGATPACLVQYDGICSQNAVLPMPQMKEAILKVSASGNVARDGNIAIQEEFDAAMLANSFAAWELFIRRHPDHPLAEKAWQEVQKIKCS